MKELTVLYDYYSPAYKAGGPIQSLVNLVEAVKSELNVSIICTNADLDGTVLDVEPDQWIKTGPVKVYYNSKGYFGIAKVFPRESVIYINGIYSPFYNFLPAIFLQGRKIISVRGMLHPGGLSEKSIKKHAYLMLCRLAGFQRKCEFHASTELEKEYIQRVFGKKVKVWVIPNLPNVLEYTPPSSKHPGHLRIATIALISPMKNHLDVIRALGSCNHQVNYDIYGAIKDKEYWRRCLAAARQLPDNIKLKYHGSVLTEQIDSMLAATDVYVQPSKSENFGHSLYEALAKGRPVITSHATPWSGLQASAAGFNIDPENPGQLLDAINHFAVMDHNEFDNWCRSARGYADRAIDLEQVRDQYIRMFKGE